MSQTLYEEAIAEARRLTEMAEQNAKNKIIDAVTPQIKRLIEQELMGDPEDLEDDTAEMEDAEEQGGDSEDADEDSAMGVEGDAETVDLDSMLAGVGAPPPAAAPAAMSPAAKASGISNLKVSDGEVEIKVGNVKIEIEEEEEEEELEESTARKLSSLLSSTPAARRRLRERLTVLERKVLVLKRALAEARRSGTPAQQKRVANIFESLVREAVTLKKQIILTEKNTGGRTLETKLVNSIIKEMRDMSRRSNKNAFDFLFEGEEEDTGTEETESEDTEGMESEDTGGDVDMSAAGDALKALGDALGLDVTVGGEDEEGGDEEAGGEEDEEDEEVELDLGESDMEETYEAEMIESDMDEADEMDEGPDTDKAVSSEGKTYEIDEVALHRELRRLRSMNEGEAVAAASSFGGGEAGDEMFVDVDEETLLNALVDELGDAPRPKPAAVAESRRAMQEARALRKQVSDYRNVAGQLKKQLVEMNLFNAKLLFANKLMQNRDLSAKQQRAIVEALDNAKTLREAKLLYKSLTSSLNKAVNRGSLSEGRDLRTLGSSSKSARSAQPSGLISESGGTDRWALLAGIKKD